MQFEPLTAVSSIDGRYRVYGDMLAAFMSEYALIRARVKVECEYLVALSETKGVGPVKGDSPHGASSVKGDSPHGASMRKLTSAEKEFLANVADVSLEDARIVKKIEQEGYEGIPATNHDMKAVEYFLKSKLKGTSLEDISEWTHFALTSEDVNSIAHALLLGDAIENALLPALDIVQRALDELAREHAATPMLARTHGQTASPTTFGKEIRVYETRISRQLEQLQARTILVKFGGATGNWSAHTAAAPDVDWQAFSKKFVEGFNVTPKTEHKKKTGVIRVELNDATTQIEPHDTLAELFDNLRRINTILLDLSQDLWRYVSDGWLTQKIKEGEVGSSAMPHKVNPIDFENAEGNLGVANALFEFYARKLPISRLQRDLSDSTVERTFGTALGHSYIAYRSIARGLGKINVNEKAMLVELQKHPEVIAEAIQTVLRREGVVAPYEKLKAMTRGREVSLDDFATFIDGLDVAMDVKKRLKALRPENYIGLASAIARTEA